MNNSISAYMQAYSNKRAVYECLKEFRKHYPNEVVTLVSDAGEDFSDIANAMNVRFKYSNINILPKGQMCGISGVEEYFRRIYNHCISVDSDWVVLLEEDVLTTRPISRFPSSDAAGPRINPYKPMLTEYLISTHGNKSYGYGMCGGSIFKRTTFIRCYETSADLTKYLSMDGRLFGWSDIPLTLLFHVHGYSYSVWDETTEKTHINKELRIYGDGAFDHAYKYWYGKEFDDNMLSEYL